MALDQKVGLGPGHIVLDGNPAPLPKKGAQPPNFRPMFVPNGWMDQDDTIGMEVGLGPGHFVVDGDPAPPKKSGHCPQFSAYVYCGQTAG